MAAEPIRLVVLTDSLPFSRLHASLARALSLVQLALRANDGWVDTALYPRSIDYALLSGHELGTDLVASSPHPPPPRPLLGHDEALSFLLDHWKGNAIDTPLVIAWCPSSPPPPIPTLDATTMQPSSHFASILVAISMARARVKTLRLLLAPLTPSSSSPLHHDDEWANCATLLNATLLHPPPSTTTLSLARLFLQLPPLGVRFSGCMSIRLFREKKRKDRDNGNEEEREGDGGERGAPRVEEVEGLVVERDASRALSLLMDHRETKEGGEEDGEVGEEGAVPWLSLSPPVLHSSSTHHHHSESIKFELCRPVPLATLLPHIHATSIPLSCRASPTSPLAPLFSSLLTANAALLLRIVQTNRMMNSTPLYHHQATQFKEEKKESTALEGSGETDVKAPRGGGGGGGGGGVSERVLLAALFPRGDGFFLARLSPLLPLHHVAAHLVAPSLSLLHSLAMDNEPLAHSMEAARDEVKRFELAWRKQEDEPPPISPLSISRHCSSQLSIATIQATLQHDLYSPPPSLLPTNPPPSSFHDPWELDPPSSHHHHHHPIIPTITTITTTPLAPYLPGTLAPLMKTAESIRLATKAEETKRRALASHRGGAAVAAAAAKAAATVAAVQRSEDVVKRRAVAALMMGDERQKRTATSRMTGASGDGGVDEGWSGGGGRRGGGAGVGGVDSRGARVLDALLLREEGVQEQRKGGGGGGEQRDASLLLAPPRIDPFSRAVTPMPIPPPPPPPPPPPQSNAMELDSLLASNDERLNDPMRSVQVVLAASPTTRERVSAASPETQRRLMRALVARSILMEGGGL